MARYRKARSAPRRSRGYSRPRRSARVARRGSRRSAARFGRERAIRIIVQQQPSLAGAPLGTVGVTTATPRKAVF